jgi:hypothetical protein
MNSLLPQIYGNDYLENNEWGCGILFEKLGKYGNIPTSMIAN